MTDVAIQAEGNDNVKLMEQTKLEALVDVLVSSNLPQCLTKDEFLQQGGNLCNYKPVLELNENQSDASFREQTKALKILIETIDKLKDARLTFVDSVWTIEAPGAGKTFLLKIACTYAIAQRHKVLMKSLTAQRARSCGGKHIHLLLNIPVVSNRLVSSAELCELALQKLLRHPDILNVIRRTRVLFFEEIGLLSRELLFVIDSLLRTIKGSRKPFGGALFLASGDHRQLSPISGNYVLLTTHFLTSVSVAYIRNLVRSHGDRDLQKVITLMRKSKLTQNEVRRIMRIFDRRCAPNCLQDWSELEEGVLRIVGKKSALKETTNHWITEKKSNPQSQHQDHLSNDEVSQGGTANWVAAPPEVVRMLDYKTHEQHELTLFRFTVMQLTFNNNRECPSMPIFSQGQTVVILELPDETLERRLQTVKLKFIPNETHNNDINNLDPTCREFKIKRSQVTHACTRSLYSLVRSEQWPLRYYVCQTIHRCL